MSDDQELDEIFEKLEAGEDVYVSMDDLARWSEEQSPEPDNPLSLERARLRYGRPSDFGGVDVDEPTPVELAPAIEEEEDEDA